MHGVRGHTTGQRQVCQGCKQWTYHHAEVPPTCVGSDLLGLKHAFSTHWHWRLDLLGPKHAFSTHWHWRLDLLGLEHAFSTHWHWRLDLQCAKCTCDNTALNAMAIIFTSGALFGWMSKGRLPTPTLLGEFYHCQDLLPLGMATHMARTSGTRCAWCMAV